MSRCTKKKCDHALKSNVLLDSFTLLSNVTITGPKELIRHNQSAYSYIKANKCVNVPFHLLVQEVPVGPAVPCDPMIRKKKIQLQNWDLPAITPLQCVNHHHQFIFWCHEEFNFVIYHSSQGHFLTIQFYFSLKSSIISFSSWSYAESVILYTGADQQCCCFYPCTWHKKACCHTSPHTKFLHHLFLLGGLVLKQTNELTIA